MLSASGARPPARPTRTRTPGRRRCVAAGADKFLLPRGGGGGGGSSARHSLIKKRIQFWPAAARRGGRTASEEGRPETSVLRAVCASVGRRSRRIRCRLVDDVVAAAAAAAATEKIRRRKL